jgi:hypothetical protein
MQLRTPPPARRVQWEMPPTNFQPSPYYHVIKMEAWKLSKMMLQMYTNVWAGIKGPWSVQTILQPLGQSQGVTLSVRQWLLGPQTTSTNLERLFHQSVAEGTDATGCYRNVFKDVPSAGRLDSPLIHDSAVRFGDLTQILMFSGLNQSI